MPSSAAATSMSTIAHSYVQTQEQLMPVEKKHHGLFIGLPRETTLQENRVALIPSSVATLTARGHRVVIETGAGELAHFTDHEYSEAGAEIAYSAEKVYKAEVILKVAPPTLDEIELCFGGQIIISPLQAPIITEEYINKMRQKRVIALAMEYIKDEAGSFPIVRTMAEIAGLSAMLTAAELLSASRGGIGVLLGGIAGVPPAKVVVLGAGVVAEFATRVALVLQPHQFINIIIKNTNFCAQAQSNACCKLSNHTRTQNNHFGRWNACNAAQYNANATTRGT